MSTEVTIWLALVVAILFFLAIDFFLFGRRGITFRSTVIWSIFWLGLGMSFTFVMGAWQGGAAAEEYLAGYLIERSLSIDNIFVFALIFASFAIPTNKQGRLLSIGIVMALVMRAVFIVAGAALLDAFHFTIYLFGLLLVATGIKLAGAIGLSFFSTRPTKSEKPAQAPQ